MNSREKMNELNKMLDDIEFYSRVNSKLSFDESCLCPKDNRIEASEDSNRIGMEIFKILKSKKFTKLVIELHENDEGLNDLEKKLISNLYKDYNDKKNISTKLMERMQKASSSAYINWLEAKEAKDYSLFCPYLKEMVEVSKKAYLTREKQLDTLYDTILDSFEENWNIARYDSFFNTLKEELIPLIQKVVKSKRKIREDFLTRNVPIYKQDLFSRYLLEKEGHSFNNLVLLTTEHPFTSSCGTNDERVTTHYYEDNFLSNVYSIMHEGGHALFDLGEPIEFKKNHISGHMTMAMHECMSRLFENMVSRSEGFVHLIYPKFKELFKDEFSDVTEEELYLASNIARPSLNRCDADELTYSMHIIVRYELEKEFINNKVNYKTLNKKWNKLYKEYLGVKVPDDKEGILQDVHWTGTYGYFPTYALGSAYAAQIYHKMNEEFDINEAIRNDEVYKIVNWLRDHAWNIASIRTPDEWIKEVTGEEFNPMYYVNYLKEKYSKIYELD